MVSHLQGNFDFYVFTSDRDLGMTSPYPNLQTNEWIQREQHKVFYCSPENHSGKILKDAIENIQPDVAYISGIFSYKYSVLPLLMVKNRVKKVVVSPRGMLNEGALKLKPGKKQVFLFLAKKLGWYKHVVWHATSDEERARIELIVKPKKPVIKARNLVSVPSGKHPQKEKKENTLNMLFLGRISKVKNLHFLIETLNLIEDKVNIYLDVIGTFEDEAYAEKCKKLLDKNNSTYKVNFLGQVPPKEVEEKWQDYDVLISPTLNENFGHAIIEALQNTLPVIISDQTPWSKIIQYQCGWVLPLQHEKWIKAIVEAAKANEINFKIKRENTQLFLQDQLQMQKDIDAYLRLFS